MIDLQSIKDSLLTVMKGTEEYPISVLDIAVKLNLGVHVDLDTLKDALYELVEEKEIRLSRSRKRVLSDDYDVYFQRSPLERIARELNE